MKIKFQLKGRHTGLVTPNDSMTNIFESYASKITNMSNYDQFIPLYTNIEHNHLNSNMDYIIGS